MTKYLRLAPPPMIERATRASADGQTWGVFKYAPACFCVRPLDQAQPGWECLFQTDDPHRVIYR